MKLYNLPNILVVVRYAGYAAGIVCHFLLTESSYPFRTEKGVKTANNNIDNENNLRAKHSYSLAPLARTPYTYIMKYWLVLL